MSAAATHVRLLEIEEVFVKEIASAERLIAAVSAERDAALSGARTAERRLLRVRENADELRRALAAEAELRVALLSHAAATEAKNTELWKSRGSLPANRALTAAVDELARTRRAHEQELFGVRGVLGHVERDLVHARADLADALEDVNQLRLISLARAERIAHLERDLAAAKATAIATAAAAAAAAAAPSTPHRSRPLSPRSRGGQRTHRAQSPTRRRSSPIDGSPRAASPASASSHASASLTSPRSPRSSRRAAASSAAVPAPHERFGPPPELPNVEPPPMPDTLPPLSASGGARRRHSPLDTAAPAAASAPPPPLPPALPCDDCSSLRRAVAEQRDQIALLESSASRRKSDQEKLALLERQVDALAREIVAERELRRELELANDRIARLTKLVDQVPVGSDNGGMSTALFASATTSHADLQSSLPSYADLVSDEVLIDEEAQRMATLPRFDADAMRAADDNNNSDDGSLRAGLPAIISQNAMLQRMAMQVAAKSLAAIEQSDSSSSSSAAAAGGGDHDRDRDRTLVVAGDARASLGMQTLSRIKEMMAELLEDGRA